MCSNALGADHSVTTTERSDPATATVDTAVAQQRQSAAPNFAPRDVQAEITQTIIEALESGQSAGTFQMPWHAIAGKGLSVNAVTGQPYHGINVLLLSYIAHKQNWPNSWASFQQWRGKGASVKKGERGTPIVFYMPHQIAVKEKDALGNEEVVVKTIPILRYSTVFNISQVDNPPAVTTTKSPVKPIETVEQFIASTKVDIRYGGNRAYYSPTGDFIGMPVREAFVGSKTSSPTETFYATVLHELCHWTSHKTRLNRQTGKHFGDGAYAAEELVADIGAAFACASLGITPELREDHIQYVGSWLKILKSDKKAIFHAASEASHALEYLEGLQPAKES